MQGDTDRENMCIYKVRIAGRTRKLVLGELKTAILLMHLCMWMVVKMLPGER
jgi:hypothetical protein